MDNLSSESCKIDLITKEKLNEMKKQRYNKELTDRQFIDNYNKMINESRNERERKLLEELKEPEIKQKRYNIFSLLRIC